MSDFGGKLRLARERRGISLRQIAASTKISVAALEALERNDVSKLPGGIFSRAFVRSYAVEVGLDPDETVREFLDRFQGEPSPSATVQIAVPEEESTFESQQRMASVVLKLVLISVPLVGVILYFTMRPRPAQSLPAAAAVEQAAPPPDPPSPLPAQPASPAPTARVPAALPADATRKTMTLELHPTGDCWIGLTVDGARVMSRVMRSGETGRPRSAHQRSRRGRRRRRVRVLDQRPAGQAARRGRPGPHPHAHEGHDGRVPPVAVLHGVRLPLSADRFLPPRRSGARRPADGRGRRPRAARARAARAPHASLRRSRSESIAASANATLDALPVEPLQAFLARSDVPDQMREFFATRGVERRRSAGRRHRAARRFRPGSRARGGGGHRRKGRTAGPVDAVDHANG